MGLAIVSRIVQWQGGRVWFESAPSGRGTVFKFQWKKNQPVAVQGGDAGMRSSKVVTILLVEDDEIDVKALPLGVRQAEDREPASDRSRRRRSPGRCSRSCHARILIITDINMPRMNGIELLRKIRQSEHCRDSIVFMLTTSNDEQDKIDAYDLNVAGYMLKSDMGTSFTRAIGLIENYWKVVEFPERE